MKKTYILNKYGKRNNAAHNLNSDVDYPPKFENRREFIVQDNYPISSPYQLIDNPEVPNLSYLQAPATFMPAFMQEESQISAVKCSSKGCNINATSWCRCKNQYLHFCDEHLGNHIINSPGSHNFRKLLDGSNIQTNSDFLLYMQYKMQLLRDLKEKLVNEVYTEICKLENSLMIFIEKIDQEIASFEFKFNETTQEFQSCYWYKNDDYFNQLPYEAAEFIKENQKTSISEASYETIISEIYKELGCVKNTGFPEISRQNEYEVTNPRPGDRVIPLPPRQYIQIPKPPVYQQFKPYEDLQPGPCLSSYYPSNLETAKFKSKLI
ncbi:unnamed protein product [Blepharisma stoltei]|uniref:Uncharacterized protein n=1 Tax=Blepharisma stoltei TaxID=1481888 RepID=A0AAU9JZU6_9CILI|nr:unnamed protein product [Blepharisma stoltei]